MAGAGGKNWSAGDIVTATDFNTYLADQVIMVFADATARDAGFGGAGEPTLAEGMFCYLTDTQAFQSYNGSSWITIGDSDIITVDGSGNVTISGTGDFTVGTSNAQILGPASGSPAAGDVSYSFKDDTDTGFYRSAADTFHAVTGGTARATFDSTDGFSVAGRPTPGVYHATASRLTAITITANGDTNIDSNLDLTVTAAAGDVILYTFDTFCNSGSNVAHFVPYTLNGSTAVNTITPVDTFNPAFWNAVDSLAKGFSWTYKTVSGDIFSSQVKVGLFVDTANVSRTVVNDNVGVRVSLTNLGPEVT